MMDIVGHSNRDITLFSKAGLRFCLFFLNGNNIISSL